MKELLKVCRIMSVFFLASFLNIIVHAQDCVISATRQNQLLLCNNDIEVLAKGIPNDSLYFITNNGVMERDSGGLRIIPRKLGDASIFVYKVSKSDTIFIAEKEYKVVSFKEYIKAKIAGHNRGTIKRNDLLTQRLIFADLENLDISATLSITNYRIILLREDSLVFTKQNNSNKLTDEIKNGLRLAKRGDILYVVDIKVLNPGTEQALLTVGDIVLTIE